MTEVMYGHEVRELVVDLHMAVDEKVDEELVGYEGYWVNWW